MSTSSPTVGGADDKTLLLVEDDPALSQMLRWELEELGYRLVVANSCHEARAHCCARRFEVAVLDLDLPDGDGMDLAEELVRHCTGMRVIICSGRHQRREIKPDVESAIHAVLTKPVSIADLTQLLTELDPSVLRPITADRIGR